MNKKQVNVISIAFVTIGIISASLIAYDHFANQADRPNLIGRESAEKIAISNGDWNQGMLDDKLLTSKLLHIKNDGFAFLVDPNSFEDKEVFMTKFLELDSNQYVWMITIQNQNNREWNYLIDAKIGNIIKSTNEDFAEFKPINPYESIAKESLITQARGDVTIKFPKGITESKSSPFPAKLVVTVNDTVTWKNHDSQIHSVASISHNDSIGKIFDSGILKSESSFSFTFEQTHIGNIDYSCLLHPWETGTIIVQNKN